MFILNIIIIIILAFLPILIWAYIFSYLDNSKLNSKRFVAWIFAGWISVVPVLYVEEIINYLNLDNYNIFNLINYFEPYKIFISLILIILIVSVFMFSLNFLFIENFLKTYKTYIKNSLIFLFFCFVYLIIYFVVNKFGIFDSKIDSPVNIWNNIFKTIWGILLYYLIVWILEESSKHFGFLTSSLPNCENFFKWIVFATFIALGFGFIENILYFKRIIDDHSFGSQLITIAFFRWIFSIFVHILCSLIIAKWFLNWYFDLLKNKTNHLFYYKLFFIALCNSIIIHAIYDISLTIGFSFIIFLYLIFWYLYITKLFYKDN